MELGVLTAKQNPDSTFETSLKIVRPYSMEGRFAGCPILRQSRGVAVFDAERQTSPNTSVTEKSLELTAGVNDAQNKHVLVFDKIQNRIFANGKAPVAGAEIFLAGTSHIGKAGKREEAVCNGVDEAVGNLDAATFLGNV